MKGMTTCKVCGRDFPLMAEEHYVVRDCEKKGVVAALSVQEGIQYDAFDCPHCGCQNVMQVRKLAVCEDEEIEEDADHDSCVGCAGCAHAALSWSERPCVVCKRKYIDHYTTEEEEK